MYTRIMKLVRLEFFLATQNPLATKIKYRSTHIVIEDAEA